MSGEATCSECGQTLGIPRIAKLDDGEALCEDCTPSPGAGSEGEE